MSRPSTCRVVIRFINHCLEKIVHERNKTIMSFEDDYEEQQLIGKRKKHSENKSDSMVADYDISLGNCFSSTLNSEENEFWNEDYCKGKKKSSDHYEEYKISGCSDNDAEKKKKHKNKTSDNQDICELTFQEEGVSMRKKKKKKKRYHEKDLEAYDKEAEDTERPEVSDFSVNVNAVYTEKKKKKHKQKNENSEFWGSASFDNISSQEETALNSDVARRKSGYLQNNENSSSADIILEEDTNVNLKIKKKKNKDHLTDVNVFNNEAECDYVEGFAENSNVISNQKKKNNNKRKHENSDSLKSDSLSIGNDIIPQEHTDFNFNPMMYLDISYTDVHEEVDTELGSIYQDKHDQCKKKQKSSPKNSNVSQGDGHLVYTSDSVVSTPKKKKKKKHKEKCVDSEKEKQASAVGHGVIEARSHRVNEFDNLLSSNTRSPNNKTKRHNTSNATTFSSSEGDSSALITYTGGNITIDSDIWEISSTHIPENEEVSERISRFNDNLHISEELLEKIQQIHIAVDWEVPLLHTIETRLTGIPTKEQRTFIENYNIEVKKGAFSKEEDTVIVENFKEFCVKHELPLDPKPFLQINRGKCRLLRQEERILFGQYLARGLNNRLISSVFKRFQSIIVPKKGTGRRFTTEEDTFIIENVTEFKHPFKEIGKILSRCPHSVLKRYNLLMQGQYAASWDLSSCEKLLKCVMKVTLVVKVDELKHRDILEEEWKRIARKMKLHAMRLKDIWYYKLYPNLFIPDYLKTRTVIVKVFKRLLDSEVEEWDDVDWKTMAEEFEGWNGPYLKRTILRILKKVPRGLGGGVKESADYILQHISQMYFKPRRKLVYKSGQLIQLETDERQKE